MNTMNGNNLNLFKLINNSRPDAAAHLKGSAVYPNINGVVNFYSTAIGVIVAAQVSGLPYEKGKCNEKVFAFHIHEGRSCSGNGEEPFSNVKGHYNPYNCPHPQHVGDLPVLFGNRGIAMIALLTDRFTIDEVKGRAVVIHENPDDFKTQPSGNSGEKIACGTIY